MLAFRAFICACAMFAWSLHFCTLRITEQRVAPIASHRTLHTHEKTEKKKVVLFLKTVIEETPLQLVQQFNPQVQAFLTNACDAKHLASLWSCPNAKHFMIFQSRCVTICEPESTCHLLKMHNFESNFETTLAHLRF